MWIYFTATKLTETLGDLSSLPLNEPSTSLLAWKMLAWLIVSTFFIRKTFVSLKPVHLVLVCIRMNPYVSRMYPYVPVCSVCYSFVTCMLPVVLVWCFSHDRVQWLCSKSLRADSSHHPPAPFYPAPSWHYLRDKTHPSSFCAKFTLKETINIWNHSLPSLHHDK